MKKYFYILFFVCVSVFSISQIQAIGETGYVTENTIAFTQQPNILIPSRNDFVAPGVLHYLDKGDEIRVVGDRIGSSVASCRTEFYRVSHVFVQNGKTYTGYICGDYLQFQVDDNKYADEFTKAGFPKSYWKYLTMLKDQHPSWNFKAYQTGIDWNTALDNESAPGKSLIQASSSGNGGYYDTSSSSYNYYTDTFQIRDWPNWYAANRETIAYYMDPRNFLTEIFVFMFEDLSYQSSFQTEEVVKLVLGSDYLKQFSNFFMKAAELHRVSPIHLASRVRQEVGVNGGTVTSGAPFTYNGKTYSNLYNFYNIGATSGSDNWKKALIWANGGENQETKIYGRPWDSPEKSIIGGAEFLAHDYISVGQNNTYFQKWNVVTNNPFTHQYMTNIMAPMSEARSSFNSYNDIGLINSSASMTFTIPVYNNMPEQKAELPAEGNPNNYLKSLTVNGTNVDGFDGGRTDYTVYVSGSSVQIGGASVVSSATVNGLGTITLASKESDHNVEVIAQNGSKKSYHIKLIRTDEGSVSIPDVLAKAGIRLEENQYLSNIGFGKTVESFKNQIRSIYGAISIHVENSNGNEKTDRENVGTGDLITFDTNGQKQTYTSLIYGDLDGDGILKLEDLLAVQKHYVHFNGYQLAGVYYKAGNADRSNQNNNIDLLDLLQLQRQYIHIGMIEQ